MGVVRHPDPVPCASCAAGEWDMCRNDQFTEHGIKALDGFGSELYRLDPEFVIPLDEGLGMLGVLVEPTSVVAKAWQQIERIGKRSKWEPHKVLITGAGPVGLLGALLSMQRDLDVHVYDHNDKGVKPALVHDLGATYHSSDLADAAEGLRRHPRVYRGRRRDRRGRQARGARRHRVPARRVGRGRQRERRHRQAQSRHRAR